MSAALGLTSRLIIGGTVLLTCVLFLPALADPVNIVKLTVLALSGIGLLATVAVGVVRERVIPVPTGAPVYAAGALLTVFIAAAVAAPSTTTAFVGTYGRNSGLIAYAAALVLFFVGRVVWSVATAHILALALLAAGAFTATYGLLQYVGVDAINWSNPFNPIIAALGNPDFASAYLGICTPVAAWGATWRRWGTPMRCVSAAVGLLCLTAALLSHAVQGPVAAGAGLVVFGSAMMLERGGAGARRGLGLVGAAALTGFVVLAAGAVKLGPAAPIFRRSSFRARQYYWDAAIEMMNRRPVLGIGLDHYGAYWRATRSDAATTFLGGDSYSDAAHSVPLQMLAQGGVLLGLVYLAFLGTIGVVLVRGLLRLDGPARLLLGAIGGAWAAYVVSSAVSIDQIPLLTVEFATAGAIAGLAGSAPQVRRLPGASMPAAAKGRQRRQSVPRHRPWDAVDGGAIAAVALVAMYASWLAFVPLRASAAVRTGDVALASGNGNAALAAYQRANELLPGVGPYWEKTGSLYELVKKPDLALAAYLRGTQHDAFDLALLQNAGRLELAAGHPDRAAGLLEQAARMAPSDPQVTSAAADALTAERKPQDALRLLARPLALFPTSGTLWASAGGARAAAGDVEGARRAFAKALSLDPANAAAKSGAAGLPHSGN